MPVGLVGGALFAALVGAALSPAPLRAEARDYESERLQRALAQHGLTVADDPEGRPVLFIRSLREQVFAPDELFSDLPPTARNWRVRTRRHPLTLLNRVHGLTRETVVLRELPLTVGAPFRAVDAEEGVRNLRRLGIFALARVVAVSVPGQDGVGVVAYTRDVWSLRFETDAQGTAGNFRFTGELTERNLFGWGKQGTLRFELRPDTVSLGQLYSDFRLLGRGLQLEESADVIFNRETGDAEGVIGRLYLGRPFYRLAQRWSYSASAAHARYIWRYLGADGAPVGIDLSDAASEVGGVCALSTPDCVPQIYLWQSTSAELAVHRRLGSAVRHTLSGGAALSDRRARAVAETGLSSAQRAPFRERLLPTERRLVYPFIEYRIDTPRYGVFVDLGTFGIQENVQLGPWVQGALGLPLRAFGSTADGLLLSGGLGLRQQWGRALAELSLDGGMRLERRRWLDQKLISQLRGATPPWGLGRWVVLGRWELRRRDTARTAVTLDAVSGLRGYPPGYLQVPGASRALGSVEYRTLPWTLEAVHLGGVVFYDAGAVYRDGRSTGYLHSAGVGARVLLPQLNRFVLRLDAGVPLGEPGFAVQVSFGAGQAVRLTPVEDNLATAGIR